MNTFNRLLAFVVLCFTCTAQIVRVANFSGNTFDGWKRCVVDVSPPHASGEVEGITYVVGRQVGVDTRVIDLKLHLASGEVKSFALAASTPKPFALKPLPANPLEFFGTPTI
ncbi:MAG: hypothetical protein E6R03_17380, partial [Hyphomicrobiaceae bacterium]